jgi:hypothetical protein
MSATADPRLLHFEMLTHDEQRAAIRNMAADGMDEHSIAATTMLSVEMVQAILGEHEAATQ